MGRDPAHSHSFDWTAQQGRPASRIRGTADPRRCGGRVPVAPGRIQRDGYFM